MNRNEEFRTLLRELDETPVRPGSVTRAKRRLRRKNALRILGGVAAVLALFVLLVNVSPTLAQAVEKVPWLGGVVIQLKRSASLEEAAMRGYAQPIDLTKTEGDITYHVDYMLADEECVSVFFTVESAAELEKPVFICQVSDGKAPVYGVSTGRTVSAVKVLNGEGDNQYCAKAIFEAGTPESFQMRIGLQPKTGMNPSDAITLNLTPDPEKTVPTRRVELNQSFTLEGRTLTVTDLEWNLHMLVLHVAEAPENDLELANMRLYLVTADGHHLIDPYDILYPYWKDDGGVKYFVTESPIFYDTSELTLYITRVDWKIPGKDRAYIDLEAGTAEGLPDTCTLLETVREGGGWRVVIRNKYADLGGSGFAVNWCFDAPDVPDGFSPEIMEHRKLITWETDLTGEVSMNAEDPVEGSTVTTLCLTDYPGTETWIITSCDHTWRDMEDPVVVSLPMPQE